LEQIVVAAATAEEQQGETAETNGFIHICNNLT